MLTYLSKENMKRFCLGAGILFVVYFIYLLCIGVFTSTCKEAYTPPQLNEQSTDKDKAVILADALTFSVEQELDSFFGWLLMIFFCQHLSQIISPIISVVSSMQPDLLQMYLPKLSQDLAPKVLLIQDL